MKNIFQIKYVNYTIIVLLSLLSIVMLSSFVNRIINPPISAEIDEEIYKYRAEEVIQVNILNACGVSGLASETEGYLREVGFDVVEIGNYDVLLNESIIIDRLGDKASARKVANAIGLADTRIITKIDSSLYLRASIVLGNDYKALKFIN